MPADPWAAFRVSPSEPAAAPAGPDPWAAFRAEPEPPPAEAEQSQSLMDRWNAAAPRRTGAGKAVMNMLAGAYDIGNMGPGRTGPTARELLQADPSNPSAPNITPSPEEQGGYTAANIAAFLAPTPAGKGALAAAALNAAQAGGLTYLQGGTGGETGTSAAIAAAGPLIAGAAKAGAPLLRRAAETQYGRALNATTNRLKDQSKRIVPELLDRRVTGSLDTLAAKGAEESAAAGKALETAYSTASNAGVQSQTAPIIKNLEKVKQRFYANSNSGTPIAVNPGAIAKVEAIQELVGQFGGSARPDQLWAMRKNIDDIIEASGGFTGPVTPGTTKTLQREARTAIQKELNKASPSIETLNREFSLWKGLEDVSKATIKRKEGQTGIVELGIRSGIGSGAGYFLGDGDPKWTFVGGLLASLTKSPAYRTFSASGKARLAFALSKGDTETAASVISRALAGFATSASPDPEGTAILDRSATAARSATRTP